MTGFEYTAAVGMLYEGMQKEGLRCIQNIRNRYDGAKRSPFDEAECGHHYARAMASWAAVLALSGFHYSAVENRITFDSNEGSFFWSNGSAYGMANLTKKGADFGLELSVLNGDMTVKEIVLNGFGMKDLGEIKTVATGKSLNIEITKGNISGERPERNGLKWTWKQIPRPPVIKDEDGKVVRVTSFSKPVTLHMESQGDGYELYYTLDGSEPDMNSTKYSAPIKIKRSVTVKAVAYLDGKRSIRTSSSKLYKITAVNDLQLKHPASHKYPGHGSVTLVDGIRGNTNFHDGRWLGFEETDLEATIDIGKIREVKKLLIGCLNDPRSWIFLPVSVEISGSLDGKYFETIASLSGEDLHEALGNESSEEFGRTGVHDLNVPIKPAKFRYINLKVKNTGICPEGHPGAGGKAWLFVDEIIIE
jgi:hypothetical protein